MCICKAHYWLVNHNLVLNKVCRLAKLPLCSYTPTDYYVCKGGSVYALSLDASKAFDTVQNDKLLNLLVDRKMNPLYIKLLMSMYINQKLRFTFNGNSSEWFNVMNGVTQGGVVSATLFGIYIDGMLLQLKESGIGCHIGDVYCGGLGYTGGLTLLVPTVKSLKKMVHVCEKYALEFNITFNRSKSQLMISRGGQHECDIYVGGE